MRTLHRYHVVPVIPPALAALESIARNLWWSWNRPARDLFARIEPTLYEEVAENPLALLACVSQRRLEELAADAEEGRARGGAARWRARLAGFPTRHTVCMLPTYNLYGRSLMTSADWRSPDLGPARTLDLGADRRIRAHVTGDGPAILMR